MNRYCKSEKSQRRGYMTERDTGAALGGCEKQRGFVAEHYEAAFMI